jgi:hypothetical protein
MPHTSGFRINFRNTTKSGIYLLKITLCGCLHDLATGNGGTGKGDLVDVGMGREGCTANCAEGGDSVYYAWGEASGEVGVGVRKGREMTESKEYIPSFFD